MFLSNFHKVLIEFLRHCYEVVWVLKIDPRRSFISNPFIPSANWDCVSHVSVEINHGHEHRNELRNLVKKVSILEKRVHVPVRCFHPCWYWCRCAKFFVASLNLEGFNRSVVRLHFRVLPLILLYGDFWNVSSVARKFDTFRISFLVIVESLGRWNWQCKGVLWQKVRHFRVVYRPYEDWDFIVVIVWVIIRVPEFSIDIR